MVTKPSLTTQNKRYFDTSYPIDDIGEVDEGKLLSLIDQAVLPWLAIYGFLTFLGRSSMGVARVSGPRSVGLDYPGDFIFLH